jgi:hypothetical protein
MFGGWDTVMRPFANKKIIVGSVAAGPYTNYGNRLIEQSTLNLLGLPESPPKFSIFEPIDDRLLEFINAQDYLVVTGCTTLQDDSGHQRCFDEQFQKIRIPKICFGGTFYCEYADTPSLRIAQLYDRPIGARDPWAANYLMKNGIECRFIGCPTLLDGPDCDGWTSDTGDLLISSTPPLELEGLDIDRRLQRRYLAHDADSPGEPLTEPGVFRNASLVMTGRLHAALPAIAQGVRLRFFGQRYWQAGYRSQEYGSIRYSLLQHLGIPLDGSESQIYPTAEIKALKRNCQGWIESVFV